MNKPREKDQSKAQQITEYLKQFPTDRYTEVAQLFGVSIGYVSTLADKAGLPKRRLRCSREQAKNPVTLPHSESEAQITEELEQAKRRVAELERKQTELRFHYDADPDTGMFTIRQGPTTVTAHYRFWFAFLNNGEPARTRESMTNAFCRKEAA